MGVCGCGKSSVAKLLASRLNRDFVEGDDFHPAANVDKMRAGRPLDDTDRWPWLQALGEKLHSSPAIVMTCSALKKSYRDFLRLHAGQPLTFLCLSGPRSLLEQRLNKRQDHYMPASLLESQLRDFDPPIGEDHVLMLPIEQSLEAIVEDALIFIVSAHENRLG